jgi:hypothetical protein
MSLDQDVGPPNAAPEQAARARRNVELLDDALFLLPALVQCKSGLVAPRKKASRWRKAVEDDLRWQQLSTQPQTPTKTLPKSLGRICPANSPTDD